jgi:hypothetical protein
MMLRPTRCLVIPLLFALFTLAPAHSSAAQQRDSVVAAASITPQRMETFVRAHLEVMALLGETQAELAAISAKKVEVQAQLRDKLQVNTQRILKAHGLTETEFADLTRLASTDGTVRAQFESTVKRLTDERGIKPFE